MATGLLMLLLSLWIFVRTWWGGLPRALAQATVG